MSVYREMYSDCRDTLRLFHRLTFGKLKRLYDYVQKFADTKYAIFALFISSFLESAFFIIPPDILLVTLCAAKPKKAFYYAFICAIASILGSFFGYLIGFGFYTTIGNKIITFFGIQTQFDKIGILYSNNAFVALLSAALAPIPFKLFTISAGVWKINLLTFFSASVIGRSLRFFIEALIVYYFREKVKKHIEKYFEVISVIVTFILIAGLLILNKVI